MNENGVAPLALKVTPPCGGLLVLLAPNVNGALAATLADVVDAALAPLPPNTKGEEPPAPTPVPGVVDTTVLAPNTGITVEENVTCWLDSDTVFVLNVPNPPGLNEVTELVPPTDLNASDDAGMPVCPAVGILNVLAVWPNTGLNDAVVMVAACDVKLKPAPWVEPNVNPPFGAADVAEACVDTLEVPKLNPPLETAVEPNWDTPDVDTVLTPNCTEEVVLVGLVKPPTGADPRGTKLGTEVFVLENPPTGADPNCTKLGTDVFVVLVNASLVELLLPNFTTFWVNVFAAVVKPLAVIDDAPKMTELVVVDATEPNVKPPLAEEKDPSWFELVVLVVSVEPLDDCNDFPNCTSPWVDVVLGDPVKALVTGEVVPNWTVPCDVVVLVTLVTPVFGDVKDPNWAGTMLELFVKTPFGDVKDPNCTDPGGDVTPTEFTSVVFGDETVTLAIVVVPLITPAEVTDPNWIAPVADNTLIDVVWPLNDVTFEPKPVFGEITDPNCPLFVALDDVDENPFVDVTELVVLASIVTG